MAIGSNEKITPPARRSPRPLSPNEQRRWSVYAHLTVLINLVTGVLGPLAAYILYLVFKRRSPLVAFHALQSAFMQLILWVGGLLVALLSWLIAGALAQNLVGICLMPIAFVISLVPMAAIGYGILAAVEVSLDRDFRYKRVSDWALRFLD